MANPSVHRGDHQFTGKCTFSDEVVLPADTLGDAQVDSDRPLGADKTIHRFSATHAQKNGTNVAAETVGVYAIRALNGGYLRGVSAALTGVAATGDREVDVDIQVASSGVAPATVLDGPIELKSTAVLNDAIDATLLDEDTLYPQGQLFLAVVTLVGSSGTIPQGLLIQLDFDLKPQ